MKKLLLVPVSLTVIAVSGITSAQHAQELAIGNEATVTLGYPVRRTSAPIHVDGTLDASEWSQAVRVGGFRLSGSEELAPEQTVMQLLYDADNLYLAVKCAESQVDKLVTTCRVHDSNVWHDDCVEFFVDAKHDHATYWHFIVNSAGVRYDAAGFDRTWTAAWTAAASTDDRAWYVEVAIPFKALKVTAPSPGTAWGFNLDRERRAGSGGTQLYNWADVKGVFHSPRLFGHLWFTGIAGDIQASTAAQVAELMEGEEARVYIEGGYWAVKAGSAPAVWSYRDLLRAQKSAVGEYWQKLEEIYRQTPAMILHDEFETFRERYAASRRLAEDTGPVDPEACAAAKVFLDSLVDRLRNLYWTVRIEQLNQTF